MTDIREIFHREIIPRFLTYLKPDSVVYEIGKGEYDYKGVIPHLITIDRDKNKYPDLVMDIEQTNNFSCKFMMCVGVTEECNNPFELVKGIHRILDEGGIVLFGIALIGNPIYDKDYWRFTERGAYKLITPYFKILELKAVGEKYLFFIVRKI